METLKSKYICVVILLILSLPFIGYANQMQHLRNQRYCEIIIPQARMNFAVYNTIGLNDCPADIWNKITVDSVKKETKRYWVFLNGPRYWVIDGMKNSTLLNPKPQIINGLAFREAGILHLKLRTLIFGSKPYRAHIVKRKTIWIYSAHRPVYELLSPQGEVYVMQSYSTEKIPQTESDLAQLGSKLKLPKGWRFKTGILSQDKNLKAIDNEAIVVQDEFLNTYQLATHDFLVGDRE